MSQGARKFFMFAILALTTETRADVIKNVTCIDSFCFVEFEQSDWFTAHNNCLLQSGSLLSYRHEKLIDEWMPDRKSPLIWISLHRLNNHFQWLDAKPEYRVVQSSEWSRGHPLEGKDCVVADRNMTYLTASCDEQFPVICIVEIQFRNRISSTSPDIDISDMLVNITIHPSVPVIDNHVLIDHQDLDLKSTFLNCSVNLNGRSDLILGYSWLKDGVYLRHNASILLLAGVNDESKTEAPDSSLQKQGTYMCQVRFIGSLRSKMSSPLLITFDHIINGIANFSLPSAASKQAQQGGHFINERIIKYIEKISVDKGIGNPVISWDYIHIIKKDGYREYYISLYLNVNFMQSSKMLEKFYGDYLELISSSLHQRNITVKWATYCLNTNEFIDVNGEEINVTLPSVWSGSKSNITNDNIVCIGADNRSKRPVHHCRANFTSGAKYSPMETKDCKLWNRLETACFPDYQLISLSDSVKICSKITTPSTWVNSVSQCMNHWPTEQLNYVPKDVYFNVISKLLNATDLNEVWLPIRRTSIYGPLLYYWERQSEGKPFSGEHCGEFHEDSILAYSLSGQSICGRKLERTSTELISDDCITSTRNGNWKISDCSENRPTVCSYDPNHTQKRRTNLDNLCPPPWSGKRIVSGKLHCFQLMESPEQLNWEQARQFCQKANVTHEPSYKQVRKDLATFNSKWKMDLWEESRPIKMPTLTWIGLHRSDNKNHKFCWTYDTNNSTCSFDYFNWDLGTDFDNGYYGAISSNNSWILLPSSGRLNYTLCQFTAELVIHETINIRSNPQESSRMDIRKKQEWSSSILFNGYFSNLNHEEMDINYLTIKCYEDGQLLPYNQWASYEVNLYSSSTYHCEGWGGWPRRLIQSNFIRFGPKNSYDYILFVDFSEPSQRYISLDLEPGEQETNLLINASDYERSNEVAFHEAKLNHANTTKLITEIITVILAKAYVYDGVEWSSVLKILRFVPKNSILQILFRLTIQQKTERWKNDLLSEENILKTLNTPLLYDSIKNDSNMSIVLTDIRSSVSCPRETDKTYPNITWPSVPSGTIAETVESCWTSKGQPLLRQCSGDLLQGVFWQETDLDGGCVAWTETANVLSSIAKAVSVGEITPSNALNELANITSHWEGKSIDLQQAARVLEEVVQNSESIAAEDFMGGSKALVAILSSDLQQLRSAQESPNVANSFVSSVESLMAKVDISGDDGSIMFNHSKMYLEALSVKLVKEKPAAEEDTVVGIAATWDKETGTISDRLTILSDDKEFERVMGKDAAVILPMKEISERYYNSTTLRISFSILANANLFEASRNTSVRNKNDEQEWGYAVHSPVIMAQVNNESIYDLKKMVRIYLRVRASMVSVNPICVFWDTKERSGLGGWSSLGCYYFGQVNDMHVCQCNHLTPLAILVPWSDLENLNPIHSKILSGISIFGCSLSMIGLSLVIITFVLFPKWRKSLGNKILFNLSIALFFLIVSFVGGSKLTYDERLCKAISSSTHYFLLVSFLWMLVEAIYQYLNYVKVIGASMYKSRFMRKAVPLAWGLAILPVIAVLAFDSNLYIGYKDYCWMDFGAFFWAVALPILIVLAINMVIFVLIINNVICTKTKLSSNQSKSKISWYQFRMSVCIFFLLGFSWIFGFLSISMDFVVFTYLFCIFNSLQGFAIFAFYILREKSAVDLWKEFLGICSAKRQAQKHSQSSESYRMSHINTKLINGRASTLYY